MRNTKNRNKKRLLTGTTCAVLALSAGSALAIKQSGEQKDMRRVGHTDLQGRAAYQPNFITYPDGRVFAFVGTHGGASGADAPKPNPLKPGSPLEPNGTMIVNITNPKKPVEVFHIPGTAIPATATAGQSQMVRLCLGDDLPNGTPGHVYLMRNVQGGGAAQGFEVWDVTNVTAPVMLSELRGIRNTHKHWWECKTGLAYLPGSKNLPAGDPNRWRVGQQMVVVDWKDPASPPIYIRTFGLPGAEPDGTGPLPPDAARTHQH